MTKDYSTLEKKAKNGSAVAQHNLAYEYHKNNENKKALYWWKKSLKKTSSKVVK